MGAFTVERTAAEDEEPLEPRVDDTRVALSRRRCVRRAAGEQRLPGHLVLVVGGGDDDAIPDFARSKLRPDAEQPTVVEAALAVAAAEHERRAKRLQMRDTVPAARRRRRHAPEVRPAPHVAAVHDPRRQRVHVGVAAARAAAADGDDRVADQRARRDVDRRRHLACSGRPQPHPRVRLHVELEGVERRRPLRVRPRTPPTSHAAAGFDECAPELGPMRGVAVGRRELLRPARAVKRSSSPEQRWWPQRQRGWRCRVERRRRDAGEAEFCCGCGRRWTRRGGVRLLTTTTPPAPGDAGRGSSSRAGEEILTVSKLARPRWSSAWATASSSRARPSGGPAETTSPSSPTSASTAPSRCDTPTAASSDFRARILSGSRRRHKHITKRSRRRTARRAATT